MASGAGSLPLPPTRGQPRAVQATGALIALMILGTLLRWHRLGYQSLWNDEIVTWLSAQGSAWNVITQRIENSNIPPLYYLIAHAALTLRGRLGLEEAMRLPSVVAGVLSIPLLYIVARPWIGSRVALLAAALLTVSPFHVWYSQEARPYVVLLLAALVALACAQRAIEHPDRGWWKAAFALAAAATFYLHTVGAAFIGFTVFYIVIVAAVPDASAGSARRAGSQWSEWRAGIRAAGMTYWRSWTLTFIGVALLCIPAVYRLASFPPTNSADAERPFSPVQFGYALWSFGVGTRTARASAISTRRIARQSSCMTRGRSSRPAPPLSASTPSVPGGSPAGDRALCGTPGSGSSFPCSSRHSAPSSLSTHSTCATQSSRSCRL